MSDLKLQRAVLNDRYEIKGRISTGSYAEVFAARDRANGNVVVVKALNPHLQRVDDPTLEQMLSANFQKEADILTEIRHSNIVSILDRGNDEDNTGKSFSFIVLEFMAGGDLFDYCRTNQTKFLASPRRFITSNKSAMA